MDFDRRRFLRAEFGDGALPLYPPWAGGRGAFEQRCTRCHDCINDCPENILRIAESGFPVVDFSLGECTFCGDCARGCEVEALDPSRFQAAWTYRARIGTNCLAQRRIMCDSCRDRCPESAIGMRPAVGAPATPFIHDAQCSGCGACVGSCPTRAIRIL